MSKIADALKLQIDNTKKLADLFKMYYLRLHYTNFAGANPYENEIATSNVRKVGDDTKTTKSMHAFLKSSIDLEKPTLADATALASNAFDYYAGIKQNYYLLKTVYDIYMAFEINEVPGSSTSSVSRERTGDILEVRDLIISRWGTYAASAEAMIIEKLLADQLITPLNKLDIKHRISFLQNIKKMYDLLQKKGQGLHVIDLYSTILQVAFTEIETNINKPLIQYIRNLVEELKSEVLPPIPRQKSNRKVNVIQTLIQRHRFIPDGPSRPLNELIYNLTGVKIPKGNALANLKKVAKLISKTRKYGFVVICKRIAQPMENNIWLLTDTQYLQSRKLMQSADAGVNDSVLTRSQTINKLPKVEKDQLLAAGIYTLNAEHGAKTDNYYYVLESLDGMHYRIMYPWYISIFAKTKIYEIPAERLPNFSLSTNPSTRIETYNSIINDEITERLKKPYISAVTGLSSMDRKREEVKWSVVRKKIARNMLEDYRDLFDNNKVNADTILGLITTPSIFANALQYIISSLTDTISVLKRRTDTYYSELYLAALEDLNRLKNEMARELENIYKESYADKMLKILKGGSSIRTSIKALDLLEFVILDMLKKYITEKSNVYSAIQQKIELMEAIYN